MSMRMNDLQHPYLHKRYGHKRAAGPDPVNVVLLACIFILSAYLAISVVTTARYVPSFDEARAASAGESASIAAFVENGKTPAAEPYQRGLNPAESNPTGGRTPFTGIQGKPWYEKAPYVRESLVSNNLLGARQAKLAAQGKTSSAGILKN